MYYNRQLYDSLLQHSERKQFTIITGARQTGKTTLLKELVGHLQSQKREVNYLTLENRMLLEEVDLNPENLFKFIPAVPPGAGRRYICIDEIQYATDPSNFLKYLYDTYSESIKIIATGSSAFYLDEKFKDSLAGRKDLFRLRTLNFEEYLIFRNREELVSELHRIRAGDENLSLKMPEIMRIFDEFLVFGGYPGVALEETAEHKIGRLEELRDSFLKRDILESSVKDESGFYKLFALLSEQIGGLTNVNELAGTLNVRHEQIKEYITILQKCFHIELVKPYYSNLRKELTKMPKAYFSDLGMRNVLLEDFSPVIRRADKGALLENYVFLRLMDRYGKRIHHWRLADGKEVDFVLTKGPNPYLAFEVKFNGNKFDSHKYRKFTDFYDNVKLVCVSYDGEKESLDAIRL